MISRLRDTTTNAELSVKRVQSGKLIAMQKMIVTPDPDNNEIGSTSIHII